MNARFITVRCTLYKCGVYINNLDGERHLVLHREMQLCFSLMQEVSEFLNINEDKICEFEIHGYNENIDKTIFFIDPNPLSDLNDIYPFGDDD